jgi:hypothetical protein
MGVLDTLAGSTSLTATLVSQFQLRSVSVVGIALISIWALSPVGGQASIRQLTNGTRVQIEPTTFQYLVHSGMGSSFVHSDRAQPIVYLNTLFKSSIIAPAAARATPLDPWGNVKIPRIESYENRSAVSDEDGWYNVVPGNASIYSSLIGIPISGVDASEFIDYATTIHTSYFNVKCSLDESVNVSWIITHPPDPLRFENYTGKAAFIWAENVVTRRNITPNDMRPYQFSYVTWQYSNDFRLDCNITASYVESRIVCQHVTDCKVNGVRRSKLPHLPENFTLLDIFYYNSGLVFGTMLASFGGDENAATLLDRYLSNPNLDVSDKSMYRVNATTEGNYSVRLMQVLNSYWTGVNGLYAITGGLSNDTAYYWDNTTFFIPDNTYNRSGLPMTAGAIEAHGYNSTGDGKKAKAWQAEGTRSMVTEILVANKPWVVTLAVASIVLILASLVSPLVHCFLIKGPEVMINISSLATRHNPHIRISMGRRVSAIWSSGCLAGSMDDPSPGYKKRGCTNNYGGRDGRVSGGREMMVWRPIRIAIVWRLGKASVQRPTTLGFRMENVE